MSTVVCTEEKRFSLGWKSGNFCLMSIPCRTKAVARECLLPARDSRPVVLSTYVPTESSFETTLILAKADSPFDNLGDETNSTETFLCRERERLTLQGLYRQKWSPKRMFLDTHGCWLQKKGRIIWRKENNAQDVWLLIYFFLLRFSPSFPERKILHDKRPWDILVVGALFLFEKKPEMQINVTGKC